MATEHTLPAETFAHEVLAVLARGDMTLADFAFSIDATPAWLEKVLTGEISELPLLTVVGICRKLKLLPEDIWDSGTVAQVFADFPGTIFLADDD